VAGSGGAEPGLGEGVQGGLGRGRELAEAPGQPAVQVLKHPGLGDAVRRGHRGIELEHAAAAGRVHGPGTFRVTAEPGARQAQAAGEIFRGGPDHLLVPDDSLPLLVVRTAGSVRGSYPGPSAGRN